jgi:peptidoglycan/LPS O-acetylase OafA/YrhL
MLQAGLTTPLCQTPELRNVSTHGLLWPPVRKGAVCVRAAISDGSPSKPRCARGRRDYSSGAMRSAPAASRSNSHSGTIDLARLAFAVLVVYSHSFALLAGGDHSEPLFRWTQGQITWGGLAVDSFLILSGYLITASWTRSSSPGVFFRSRVLRIYPGFAVAIALGVLLIAPLSTDGSISTNPAQWLWGTLNLRGYEPDGVFPDVPFRGSLNGSVWSISYEFWCYVGTALFGIVGWLTRRRVVVFVFLASIAVSIAFVVLELRLGGGILGVIFGDPWLWARLLPYYVAGWTFYLFRDRLPLSWPLAVAALGSLVIGAACAPWGVALTFPVALAYLLVFATRRRKPRFTGVTRYGDLSYGVYLYAFPIQQLLVRYHIARTPLVLFAAATPLAMMAALLSWHLVEKHYLVKRESRVSLPIAPAPELTDERHISV